MSTVQAYPLHMDATLDEPSRWLWLFKWILVIPHLIVLAFLWVAFFMLSVVAFFAILITGRYPRSIFDFNVGVMRWSWRVSYYANGAFATDRYPPFMLADDTAYPTHLEVEYPQHLSRGLVLIKWWLLALPHYLIVALLAGGTFFAFRDETVRIGVSGLIGLLALIAGVMLLFTGRYPQGLFDLLLGLNRWVLRVAAYAALMTDVYPPFRLDAGGSDPSPPPAGAAVLQVPPAAVPRPVGRAGGWTGGRITALVIGSIIALIAVPMVAAGVIGVVADRSLRDASGFVNLLDEPLESSGYAITSEGADVTYDDDAAVVVDQVVGDVRVRAEARDAGTTTFLGVARTADVESYLGGVARARVESMGPDTDLRTVTGGAPSTAPADQTFWSDTSIGRGERSVTIGAEAGSWAVVVMNADGSRGVDVLADIGAEVPTLGWLSIAMMAVGFAMLGLSVVLMVGAVRRAGGSL